MLTLDHLAVACTDLAEGTAWVEERLGVPMQQGGQHARYGTHNTLLGLADGLYLEVIALDPDAVPETGHSWFGLDQFTGPPRLANWICRTDDIDQAPPEAGPLRALTRGNLNWQITVPDDGGLPYDAGMPTVIKWGAGTQHPSNVLTPSGCRLKELHIWHPMAAWLRRMIKLDDDRITMFRGKPAMRAVFATPDGERIL